MPEAQLAIIGGTGLYAMEALTDIEHVDIPTPYGDTSDAIVLGSLGDVRVAFLPRHGVGHRLTPSEVPARANIWALKSLGVRQIVSVSAVGSLRQAMEPLHLVVPDQIIDATHGRSPSFFGGGLVAHVSMAQPYCPMLSTALADAGDRVGTTTIHRGGTCVTVNGPRFSTKAESLNFGRMGGDIIGMTAMPEAQLAREAEICYASLSAVTDYDAWHEEHETVGVELVLRNLAKNTETVKAILATVMAALPEPAGCDCGSALDSALVTPFDLVPEEVLHDLEPIIGRFHVDHHHDHAEEE